MSSQLFCLALLAVSAFSAHVPLQHYGVFNQQVRSSMQGQVPYFNHLLQNVHPALVQQQGVLSEVEGQVNSPLRQLLWNKQQILGNIEGLIQSFPEIVNVCQKINMQVQGLVHQTVGVNVVRDVNHILNLFGNTEGVIRSYPEIVEFCQRINIQVQGLSQQTLVEGQVNSPLRQLLLNKQQIFENIEALVQSYPEIVDICQKINNQVQGLAYHTTRVNEVREINQILNNLENTEGVVRSYPEIVEFCQRINMHVQVQGLSQQTLVQEQVNSPLRQLLWNKQQILGNIESLVQSFPEIVDICQKINIQVQGLAHQTIGVNEVRKINQVLNILGNTEGVVRSYPEIIDVCQRINVQVQGLAQQTFGVNEIRDVNQRSGVVGQVNSPLRQLWNRQQILGNIESLIQSFPEIVNICQNINMQVQGLVHQTVGVNAVRDVNQMLNIFGNTEGVIRSYPEIIDVCQKINMLAQGHIRPTTGVTDVNQRWNLPVQGQRLVRPTFEVSELTLTVPLTQTNTDGAIRNTNFLAPRFQSLHQYQPMSQVYPARQNILSLWGLKPTRLVNQVTVDPVQQIMQQNVPTYFANNVDFARNNLNVERNLVY